MRDAANENISTQRMERKAKKLKWRRQKTTVKPKDTLSYTDYFAVVIKLILKYIFRIY